MFVVVETTFDKQTADLVGGEILEGVGLVRCVTWTQVGRRRGRVGGKKKNCILANPSCLGRGIGNRGRRGSCFGNVNVKSNAIVILPLLFSLSNHGECRGWRHIGGANGRWRVQAGISMWDGARCGALR